MSWSSPAEVPMASLRLWEESSSSARVALRVRPELSERDVEQAIAYLARTYTGPRFLSAERSVTLPLAESLTFDGMKIKGAGYKGGPVSFDRFHLGDYDLPRYDWEGNSSVDAARSFQRAYQGGMTYQQAVNEFRVVSWLEAKGFETYPALGYGSLTVEGRASWFCLLNAPFEPYRPWNVVQDDPALVEAAPTFAGQAQRRLRELGLYLVLHGVGHAGQRLIRKDFHTARWAGPNDSFMSLLCYFCFDVNFELATYAHKVFATGLPNWVERAWHDYILALTGEDLAHDDIEALKTTLLKLKVGRGLDVYQRMAVLEEHPLTRRFLSEFIAVDEAPLFAAVEADPTRRRTDGRVARWHRRWLRALERIQRFR